MTTPESLIFLYGADMDPVAVRVAYPGAQFVARARIEAGGVTAPPAAEAQADVWGILVRVPGEAAPVGALVTATTDEGVAVTTTPVTAAAALADPAEVLAAARYWELPPSYVAALAAAS